MTKLFQTTFSLTLLLSTALSQAQPAGTYKFWYNGDHPSGTNYAYSDSGSGSEAGSITGSSVSNDSVTVDTAGENITWSTTSNDLVSGTKGTVFFSVYVSDEGNADLGSNALLEVYLDSLNYLRIYSADASNNITALHRGNDGSLPTIGTSFASLGIGAWYRVGYSWQTGADTNGEHAIILQTGDEALNDWSEATTESEDLDDWSGSPTSLTVGQSHFTDLEDASFQIKDVIITSEYKDLDPLSGGWTQVVSDDGSFAQPVGSTNDKEYGAGSFVAQHGGYIDSIILSMMVEGNPSQETL